MTHLFPLRMLTAVLCGSFFFILASEVHAESIGTPKDVEIIEVTNSHEFASGNYQVLRREDFIGSSQNLSDILSDVNGIQIRQISGVGNPVSISIRGSSAKQVQFYIDGQQVNDSQFGSFDLNQIPAEQIESIEVSKNQAIGTGSTPIGGVIRINTYNPSEDTNKISIGAGSFGYQELSLLKNTTFKYHSLAAGGTYLASDNNYDYLPHKPNSSTQPLKNNQFEKLSLFINDYAQIEQHQLRFNLTYNTQEKGLANYQTNSTENSSSIEMDSLRYGLQYNWISTFDYLDNVEVDYYNDDKKEVYRDSPIPSKQKISRYRTNNQHLGVKPNFTIHSFNVIPFMNATKQVFRSDTTTQGEAATCNILSTCDIEAEQQQVNIGTRVTWQSESLPLNSYVLVNQLHEDNSSIALNYSKPSKEISNKSYTTQEAGLSFGNKNLNTSLNWSNGVRTPTLYELFGDRGSFKGNANLKPEEAETYVWSIKYRESFLSGNSILPKSFDLSSSLYQQSLENSIVAIFNSSGTGTYANVSNADLLGIEMQAGSKLTDDLSLSIQAHFIDSNTESEFIAFNQKKLPGIYHQQYSATLNYEFNENWQFKLSSHIDKDLYFNRSNQIETNQAQGKDGNPANRTVTDISLRWSLKNYQINFSCMNLFDEHYQDLANRPAQGRSIQLKLSIKDI